MGTPHVPAMTNARKKTTALKKNKMSKIHQFYNEHPELLHWTAIESLQLDESVAHGKSFHLKFMIMI